VRIVITIKEFDSETSANRHPDYAANDGSGREFGNPMDGHGNAKPNVKRVKQRAEDNAPVPGLKRRQAERHGKRHGGVSRRPTPKDAAPKKAKLEAVAGVRQRRAVQRKRSNMAVKRRRAASGDCLVAGSDQVREKRRLPQSPGGRGEAAVSCCHSRDLDDQTPQDRHQHSEPECRAGQHGKRLRPRPTIIGPIAAGRNYHNRQYNGRCVPQKVPTTEDSDGVPRKPIKKFEHSAHHKGAQGTSHEF